MKKNSLLAVFVLAIVASFAIPAVAAYPVKPIKVVVPFKPGGGNDISARLFAKYWEKVLPVKVAITNIDGGIGRVGEQEVLRSRPDGYTILWANNTTYMSNIAGYSTYNWDDFTPLFIAFSSPWALSVRKDLPVSTAKEVFALADKNPGGLSWSFGPNTNVHMMVLDTVNAFGSKLENFRGIHNIPGDANRVIAMLQGNIDVSLTTLSSVLPYVKSGDLKVLGLSGTVTVPRITIPSLKDQGFNATLGQSTYVAFGPKGVPQAIVDYLAESAKKALEQPGLEEEAANLGIARDFYAGKALHERIAWEYGRMKELAEAAGVAKKK